MFRQATYNIPVAIWIPLEYPRLPPLVYVVPTSDMLVKPSKHVDPSGECSFEYMDNWRRKSEVRRPEITELATLTLCGGRDVA